MKNKKPRLCEVCNISEEYNEEIPSPNFDQMHPFDYCLVCNECRNTTEHLKLEAIRKKEILQFLKSKANKQLKKLQTNKTNKK